LGLALLACITTNAQNLLKNPDFEEPLSTNNWTVVYVAPATEEDFMVHGRSTFAHKDASYGTWDGDPYYWDKYGASFRPYTDALMEAYFTQTVSGLTPGASYLVSCWATHFNETFIAPNPVKVRAWIESVGGSGTVTSADVTGYSYNNNGWAKYSANNTANLSGKIEVRLRFQKVAFTANQKWPDIDVFFDHAAVVRTSSQTSMPAYTIKPFTLTNKNVTLNWNTVRNNRYRIQVASDLTASPIPWQTFLGDPYLDPDFLATGTNLTFTTNLFLNNPSFDPAAPLYFRIYSQPFVP
jgi:hypothetical protein